MYSIDRPYAVLAGRGTSRSRGDRVESGLGVEDRAVAELVPVDQLRDLVHGVWLETRSSSAKSGLRSGLDELVAAQARRGRTGPASTRTVGRAVVADVPPVVDLVIVVERRSLPATCRLFDGTNVDRPPAGPLERLAEREAIARDQLVVAPLAVDPDARLHGGVREPAEAAKGRRGEPPAAGEKPAACSCCRALVEHRVDAGEKTEPCTATLP